MVPGYIKNLYQVVSSYGQKDSVHLLIESIIKTILFTVFNLYLAPTWELGLFFSLFKFTKKYGHI